MKSILLTCALTLMCLAHNTLAADSKGKLVAEIDGHSINMPVTCEDTPIMLSSYSDSSVNGKSDSDGDGMYFTLGGMPTMKKILGIFMIHGQEYRFSHKVEFTLEKLVVDEVNVTRKDGSKYKISIDLTCS